MELQIINKKRKILCAISLLTTFFIIVLYVLSIILFARVSILVPIIGAVLIMVILYFFSSLFVMKQYMKLKCEVIKLSIKKDLKAKDIKVLEDKDNFLENFYKKDSINIKSRFSIVYDNNNLDLEEFEVSEKRDFKSNKVVLAGKHIKFKLQELSEDYCFVKNNETESNKFVDYYSYIYKKKDDSIYLNNKMTYTCLYTSKTKLNVLTAFEKIKTFHMISVKDNVVDIIFIDTTPIFDFKLQQSISTNNLNVCSSCFNKTIKLINLLRKGEF